jgi:hypothetical protein
MAERVRVSLGGTLPTAETEAETAETDTAETETTEKGPGDQIKRGKAPIPLLQ